MCIAWTCTRILLMLLQRLALQLPCSPLLALAPPPAAGVGSPFDPNLHDGVMRELNNDVPDGTVLEEFRKVGGGVPSCVEVMAELSR